MRTHRSKSGRARPAAVALAAVVTTAFAQTSSGAVLTVEPSSVPIGEVIDVNGTGWPPGNAITISLENSDGEVQVDDLAAAAGVERIRADDSGAFSRRIALPESVRPDYYVVRARTVDVETGTPFSVDQLLVSPRLVVAPELGAPGAEITVVGSGWEQPVDISLEMPSCCDIPPRVLDLATGVPLDPEARTFTTNVVVPSVEPGPYDVVACEACESDDPISARVPFRVVAVSPSPAATETAVASPRPQSPPPTAAPAAARDDGSPWILPVLLAGIAAALALIGRWLTRRAPRPRPEDKSPVPPGTTFRASLRCPSVVVKGVEFAAEVAVTAAHAGSGVSVQLLAFGFALDEAETWRRHVELDDAARFHLTPTAGDGPRALEAQFAVAGDVVGFVRQEVTVVGSAGAAPAADVVETVRDLEAPPRDAVAPDLTISITKPVNVAPGYFLCSIETPATEVELPDAAEAIDLGANSHDFARQLTRNVEQADGGVGLRRSLEGLGLEIAGELPDSVFHVLRRVHEELAPEDGLVTVLLRLDEAYVPWELAVLPYELCPGAPRFLATQAVVGRWPIARRSPPAGRPPESVEVEAMAFVTGMYDDPALRRLEFAEREVEALRSRFGSAPVEAKLEQVLELVSDKSDAGVMHFAIHGKYQESGDEEGLVLVDGEVLTPFMVKSARLTAAPFVFLNACHVGRGREVLGDYGGVAEAFLSGGASAVIAPLWAIDDEVAAQISLRFYDRAFEDETARPARLLRDERLLFDQNPTASTYVAYQFFGHPAYRLIARRTAR